MSRSQTSQTLFSALCFYPPPLETVKMIYDGRPNAVREKDGHGQTPLHYACHSNASFEVVLFLVKEYPAAVEETDRWGWTPLHMACRFSGQPEVVTLLADRYPAAIDIVAEGDTPLALHLARGREAQLAVVSSLTKHSVSSLSMMDRDGRTPLHCACKNRAPWNVIWFLVERYPRAFEKIDRGGNTPVQLAQQSFASMEDQTLLDTLYTVHCLDPRDVKLTSMLLQSSGTKWYSQAAPILDSHPRLVEKLEIDAKLMPVLLARVGREGRVQTLFRVVRETMNIFKSIEPL